jgi:nicotinate-nucleotide pyrophosphorylase (carboxylating)
MNDSLIQLAFQEDIGTGDVSASLLKNSPVCAHITAKQTAIICGVKYVQRAFEYLDSGTQINWQVSDGDLIQSGQILCQIQGRTRAIISAERVALNFLQTLSAVATQTHQWVEKIKPYSVKLLDTRKTIPGLRQAQKYAVTCGGGVNHRIGLYDCVMLKENHIISFGSITDAVNQSKLAFPDLPLIVEVENTNQLQESITLTGIARILCDNFTIDELCHAVMLTNRKIPLEASGNININNLIQVAKTGVDYISTGALTKNISAIDFSLRFQA